MRGKIIHPVFLLEQSYLFFKNISFYFEGLKKIPLLFCNNNTALVFANFRSEMSITA